MILQNLLRRKIRTFLTLIGISIGVAAVVALGAIAEGFINSYTTMLTSSGADIILAQGDAPDILFSAVDDVVGAQLPNMPGIKETSGVLLGMISTPDAPYFFVMGLNPKEFGLRHYKIVEGRPIIASREVLLGRTAARDFHKKVGDYYKIQDVSFKITGLYETGQAVEEMGAVISLKDAQAVFKKPNQVAYYQIKVTHPDKTLAVIKQLEQRFPKLAASRSANFMDTQQETQMLRAFSWVIGMMAVFAGGLVMANTMLMSVFERTREIGVLRALGWRRRRVLRLILGEAVVLGLIGGLLGNAIGLLMLLGVNEIPGMRGFVDNAYSPMLFGQAMFIALLLGVVGGVYPAWRASQLQPVEAMRYDGTSGKSQTSHNSQSPASHFGGVVLRNLMRQRTRTILTALTIGVGVGLVVALGGMGDGMLEQLGGMGSSVGDLMVSEAKASDMSMAAIDEKVGRYAMTLPDVQHVSGLLMGIASMPGTPYFLVFGMDPAGYGVRHFALTEGERMRQPRDMMLGRMAAKNYKKHVGDTIALQGGVFRITGIYETGIGYEDGSAVISLTEAQKLFKKPNQVSFYGIKLRDPNKADLVIHQIESYSSAVSVSRATEFGEKTNDMNTFRAATDALSFLSIFVGGVGMMNAMLMSVHERTREIGTLRALGWRRRRVVWMIMREALVLSLVSGIVGIFLGMGLGSLVSMDPTMGFMLKGVYSPMLLSKAIVIALVLGVIGALFPAWRASSLSPIEALRYE